MKKRQLLFLIVLCVYSITNLFAQDKKEDISLKRNRWELNVNANHILFPSYIVDFYPVHYFVRMKKQNENAWRFSLIPQLNARPNYTNNGNSDFFGVNVGVGHEWAKKKDKLRIYWGTGSNLYYESAGGYNGNAASQQPAIPISTNPVTFRSYSYFISLQGFVGVQYYLSKNVSVSLESKSIFYYRNIKGSDANGQLSTILEYSDWQQFPIGGLFLSYQF